MRGIQERSASRSSERHFAAIQSPGPVGIPCRPHARPLLAYTMQTRGERDKTHSQMHSPGSWRPKSAPSLLILSGSSLTWWTGRTKERGGSICGWAFLSPGHKATRFSSLFCCCCSSPPAYALSLRRPPFRPRLSTPCHPRAAHPPPIPPPALPLLSERFPALPTGHALLAPTLARGSLVSAAHLTTTSVLFLRSALCALRPPSLRQPRRQAQRSTPSRPISPCPTYTTSVLIATRCFLCRLLAGLWSTLHHFAPLSRDRHSLTASRRIVPFNSPAIQAPTRSCNA